MGVIGLPFSSEDLDTPRALFRQSSAILLIGEQFGIDVQKLEGL